MLCNHRKAVQAREEGTPHSFEYLNSIRLIESSCHAEYGRAQLEEDGSTLLCGKAHSFCAANRLGIFEA